MFSGSKNDYEEDVNENNNEIKINTLLTASSREL